jgi:riboflavin synthase
MIGASIACSGICLTAVARGSDINAHWFEVQAAAETLSRTLAGGWQIGTKVNLERSLRVGDELGGHFVTGHVDGVVRVVERRALLAASGGEESVAFTFAISPSLAPFVAEKGAVAVDGVSLTVNAVTDTTFSVLVIPHTLTATTLGSLNEGERAHIEVDMMARYAKRLAALGGKG